VYADEPVTIDGYGTARQITLFEHGAEALQILTSDTTSCPIGLLRTLKARWRIENAFKYARAHHGIDTLTWWVAAVPIPSRSRPLAVGDAGQPSRSTPAAGWVIGGPIWFPHEPKPPNYLQPRRRPDGLNGDR